MGRILGQRWKRGARGPATHAFERLAKELQAECGTHSGRVWSYDIATMSKVQPSVATHRAVNGDGDPVQPWKVPVALLKQTELGRLIVIGTGFYITRYGLFLTARHVLDELVEWRSVPPEVGIGFVCHFAGNGKIHLRRIKRVSLHTAVDVAVGQADNFVEKYRHDPLRNMRAPLTVEIPPRGTALVTYAYPENLPLDFRVKDRFPRIIKADFFDGELLGYVERAPFIPYPHLETTIEIRSGASGGPVFALFPDGTSRVVGINCRGWDFRGAEHEGKNLSSVIPISAVLDLDIDIAQLPVGSWEFNQVPSARRGHSLSVSELARYGHILFDPPI